MPEPGDTTPDPNDIYFPGACYQLYPVEPPCFPNGDRQCLHDDNSLQRQRTEGVLALSLANRMHLPSSPSLSITLSDTLCGGIREHITHVWVAHPSSPTLERTDIAKFYDPVYFLDEYESVDPLRLAARSVANEVKAYEMLQSFQGICIPRCLGLYATVIPEQDGRTIYVLLLELVAGKDLRYLCEDVEREAIVADYLCERHCEAIFTTLCRLMMDFMDLGVLQDDLAPRNVIIRPPARPGPFCSDERCPARFEIDTDDVRAVMVDFERIRIKYPPNPDTVSLFGRLFANADVKDYFASWFRNICAYPDYNG
ncbi:hypothetical protein EV421DRAFT_1831717 [Armillaria borealis]|uniref:Protein kinase domain-containing protein n=1 Tax=Armillaria borealis TaxID=47425 RepID=A0AA39J5U4_9AGAR|nr:hypothetical protein EV421DRAFT_1870498 [Armillaria borealis]KAK0436628.1 hypothetical protein EV421DRAFT_1831717 [Armillaria borealis]